MQSTASILKNLGLSKGEAEVIVALSDAPDSRMTTSELTKKLGITRSHLCAIIHALQEDRQFVHAKRVTGVITDVYLDYSPKDIGEKLLANLEDIPDKLGLPPSCAKIFRYLHSVDTYKSTGEIGEAIGLPHSLICTGGQQMAASELIATDWKDSAAGGRRWKTYRATRSYLEIKNRVLSGL